MNKIGWQVSDKTEKQIKKRYRRERRLKLMGLLAIGVALGVLLLLLVNVISRGHMAFVKTELAINITIEQKLFGEKGHVTP